jgi:hypothetical protein
MSSYSCLSALSFSIIPNFIRKLFVKSNNSSNESSSQGHDESSSYNSENNYPVPPNSPISSREGSPTPSAYSREISPAPLDKTREVSKTPPFTLVQQESSRVNSTISTISDLSFIYSSSTSETGSPISSVNTSLLDSKSFLASPRAFEPSNTMSFSPIDGLPKSSSIKSSQSILSDGQTNRTKLLFKFGPSNFSKNLSNQLSDNSTAKADESSNSDENKENILPSQTPSPTNSDLTNTTLNSASNLAGFDSAQVKGIMFSGSLFEQRSNSTAVAHIEDTPSKKPNTNLFANTQTDSQPENTNRYNKVKSRVQLFRSLGRSQDLLSPPIEHKSLPGNQHNSSGMAVTKVRDEVGDRVTKLKSDDGRIIYECSF